MRPADLRIEPPAFLSDPALQAVLAALPAARMVGGCVRDALAGLPVYDIDLATPDSPVEVQAALKQAGLRSAPTGLAHGTVTAIAGGRGFEITTLRRDVTTDGRHAEVAFSDDWQEDAARRDFTFNALSMTQGGEIHDFFNGIEDLRQGRVRFVGDPAIRVAEDRLRALRYFRFYARYAALPPDAATEAALRNVAPDLHRLSAERTANELKRILATEDPTNALALMQRLGVLQAVLPEADPTRLRSLIASGAPADPILRLAVLIGPQTAELAQRLRLSTAETTRLAQLKATPTPSPTDTDDDLRRQLADTPTATLIDRTWLAHAPDELRDRLKHLPRPKFPLKGKDALALGLTQGAEIGELLNEVREWWIAGGCIATREECLRRMGEGKARGSAPLLPLGPRQRPAST